MTDWILVSKYHMHPTNIYNYYVPRIMKNKSFKRNGNMKVLYKAIEVSKRIKNIYLEVAVEGEV